MSFHLCTYFCIYTDIGTMLMIREGWSGSPMTAG